MCLPNLPLFPHSKLSDVCPIVQQEMLSNEVCDEMCNHALCEYDITLCFKFFDMRNFTSMIPLIDP